MASKLLIDTWGWLTLHDKSERYHHQATQAYRDIISHQGLVYTTDYILDETFTLLFKRIPAHANQSMGQLLASFNQPNFHLIRITEARFSKTVELRAKLSDKPDISFTDLSSMVVMQEYEVSSILTQDAHFTHVGLGFQRVPELKT